jgi:hypothetical protein
MLPLKSPRVCPEPALRLAAAVEGKAEFAGPAPQSPLAGAARDEQRLRVLLVRPDARRGRQKQLLRSMAREGVEHSYDSKLVPVWLTSARLFP